MPLTPRRWVVAQGRVLPRVMVVVLALLALAVGGWMYRNHRAAHEDAYLRRLAATFPAGSNVHVTDGQMLGGGCDLSPSCSRREIWREVRPAGRTDIDVCTELRSAMERWRLAGFRRTSSPGRPMFDRMDQCQYQGEIGGRPVLLSGDSSKGNVLVYGASWR